MKGLFLAASWNDLLTGNGKLAGSAYSTWLTPLMNVLSTLMWVVLALVGAAGGIYAVYIGVKMARADSAEQREENKKRMINIIVSIVVVIVLIIFFNLFLPMILDAVINADLGDLEGNKGGNNNNAGGNALETVVNTVRCLIGR